eukprot:Skav234834  [mRNA]  locus=scaffold69:1172860:1173894:+ [translate_table: standard]
MAALLVNARVLQALLHRAHGVAEVVHAQLLKACAGQAAGIINAIEQGIDLDGCLRGRGQSALCTLALSLQTSDGALVATHVLPAVLALEVLDAEIHHSVVEVFSTQVSVTGSSLHFEDAILDGQQRHVESASTHIVDEHVSLASAFLVKAISDGCSSGFIDNACIFGGLTLRIIEICWHSNHCIVDFRAQICFGGLLHLQQNHGRNLFRVEFLLLPLRIDDDHGFVTCSSNDLERPQFDVGLHDGVRELAANQALSIKNCVLGIARHLVLGSITDESLSVCKSHITRCGSVALVIGNNFHAVIFPHANATVCGSKIDADCGLLGHVELSFTWKTG